VVVISQHISSRSLGIRSSAIRIVSRQYFNITRSQHNNSRRYYFSVLLWKDIFSRIIHVIRNVVICNKKNCKNASLPSFRPQQPSLAVYEYCRGILSCFSFHFLQEYSSLDDYCCFIHPCADCTSHSPVNRTQLT